MPVSDPLGRRAARLDTGAEEPSRPTRASMQSAVAGPAASAEPTSAVPKHSLDAIAARLTELDRSRIGRPSTEAVSQSPRLNETLERVDALLTRLKQQPRRGYAAAVSKKPVWSDEEHRREASQAFRERLAAIRADFDRRTSFRDQPSATASSSHQEPVRASVLSRPETYTRDEPVVSGAAPHVAPGLELQVALADIIAQQRRLDREPASPESKAGPEARFEIGTASDMEVSSPSEPEEQTSAEASPYPDDRLAGFQDQLAALTEQMERIHPDRLEGALASLRADLEAVQDRIEGVPERQDALSGEVATLAGRIEALEGLPLDADLQSVRGEIAELHAIVAATASAERVEQLAASVEELSLHAQDATDALARRIEDQAGEFAGQMQSFASNEDLGLVVDHVEALTLQLAAAPDAWRDEVAHLQAEDAGLRARIDEAVFSSERLEEEVRTLAARFPADAMDRLADQVSGLAGRVEELASAARDENTFDRIDLARIEQTLAQLSANLEAPGSRDEARLAGLEAAIRDLATRLENTGDGIHSDRIRRLESAVRDLADRIEIAGAPGASPETISVLERHVGRLADQMADMQEITVAAAEKAAQAVVQRTFEGGGAHMEALAQHLQALNKAAASAERRTQGTLESVHETLEKLVARIALIEEDIGALNPAAASESGLRGEFRAALTQAREAANDPDALLEPGSGLRVEAFEARSPVRSGSAGEFIAAARRAVQSAAVESRSDSDGYPYPDLDRFGTAKSAARNVVRLGRRPVALGIAAVVLMMAMVQLAVIGQPTTGEQVVAGNTAPSGQSPAPAADSSSDQRMARSASPADAAQAQIPADVPDSGPDMTASIGNPGDAVHSAPRTAPLGNGETTGRDVRPYATTDTTSDMTDLPRQIGGAGLRNLALGGDPTAQYEIGLRFAEGRGITPDPAQGVRWFARAAESDFAPAQYRLASMYQAGQGVERDLEAARRWYERAGLLGHVRAMHNLAVMYANGGQGPADYRQAVAWFRRAAERGLADSQVNLGVLLTLGLGATQDIAEAYKWFALAAAQGDKDAAEQRDAAEKKLDPAVLAAARQAVKTFRPLPVDPAANVVAIPPGGWDAVRNTAAKNP